MHPVFQPIKQNVIVNSIKSRYCTIQYNFIYTVKNDINFRLKGLYIVR